MADDLEEDAFVRTRFGVVEAELNRRAAAHPPEREAWVPFDPDFAPDFAVLHTVTHESVRVWKYLADDDSWKWSWQCGCGEGSGGHPSIFEAVEAGLPHWES